MKKSLKKFFENAGTYFHFVLRPKKLVELYTRFAERKEEPEESSQAVEKIRLLNLRLEKINRQLAGGTA